MPTHLLIKKYILLIPILLIFILSVGNNQVKAEEVLKASLVPAKNTLDVNEDTTVQLIITEGEATNVNAFSFLITSELDLQMFNLEDNTNQAYYIKHFKITSDTTNNINKIEILAAMEPNQTFSIQPGFVIATFKVKSGSVGNYNLSYKQGFKHAILDVNGNDILDTQSISADTSITVAPAPTPTPEPSITPSPTPNQLIIENLSLSTNKNYKIKYNNLKAGEKIYTDRDYKLESVPSELTNLTYIKTANEDKSHQNNTHLSFSLNGTANLYIAHDDRFEIKPDWMNGWNKTDLKLYVPIAGNFTLYKKSFAPGNVILGSNANPLEIEGNSMYFVIIEPIEEIEVINQRPTVEAGAHSVINFGEYAQLNGEVVDDGLINETLTYNWIKASGPGNVEIEDPHILITNAFFDTPGIYVLQLLVNDGEYTAADSIKITVKDNSINLSDLQVTGNAKYNIVESGLILGETQYADRPYGFSNIPANVEGAIFIQTQNNHKLSTENQFMQFNIDRNATIYVAHDERITTKPTWLSDWEITEDIIETPIAGEFKLYKKDFGEGTIILGGNSALTSESSMYTVIVIPR